MTVRLVHYSDVENACDDPVRMGRLAGTIDSLRDGRTVVVGAGDDTAPGVLAHHCEGRQALELFDAVGTDVETFGNHDFDFGTEHVREIAADSPQEWITANVYEDGAGDPGRRFDGASPTAVVERDGRRVGFVAVTDPATPDIAHGASELTVTDPVEAVRTHVPELTDADHVVVLAHLRTDLETAVARVEGVDAVLGGHVHGEREEFVDGTLVVRPGANGQVVWAVELPDGDGAPGATRHAVPEGPVDESVAEAIRERMAEAGLTEVVATVGDPIRRDVELRCSGESRAGNLVADAYRWAGDADVAFVPAGNLRQGRPLSGEVTAGEVASVAPFGGPVKALDVEGRRLRELLDAGFHPDRADGRIWQFDVAGMRVECDPDAGELETVTVDGDPLDDDREYRLATNAYVVFSEDWPLSRDAVVDSFGPQFQVPVDYARSVGIDVELEGRLVER